MSIEIREALSAAPKTFIYLPEKIHAGHENWVHPIYMDDWKYFDKTKNKAFGYCDTTLLVAWKDGRPAGRVMGIINHRFNEHRNERTARFGYLDCTEDKEVFTALLRAVEAWARDKGMTKIVGPYGFSDQDPEGFLIEGFEHRATIATYYNFEWMPRFLEEDGYAKDIDWFVYKLDVPREPPELYRKIFERHMKRGTFELVEFKKRKEIKPWIRPVLGLMNECYMAGNIYGFAPLEEQEMDDLAKYLPVLDTRFVKAVMTERSWPSSSPCRTTEGIRRPGAPFPRFTASSGGQEDEAARPAARRDQGEVPGPGPRRPHGHQDPHCRP
jgi:hypothetical protein